MAISLLKILDGPWENVRGYLRKDLDTIQATFNQFYAKNFPGGVISITSLSTGVGLPGNPNTSIQFNSSGVFGGDIHLTWNPVTGLTNNKHSATGANAVIDDLHFVYPAFYTGVVVNGNEELFTNLPNGVSWNVVGVSSYLQVTPSADTDATVTAFDNQIVFNGAHAVSSSILGVTGSINHSGTGTIGGAGITAGLFGAVYKNSTGIVDGSITLATCGVHAEIQNFAAGSITYADHLHSGQAIGAYGTWNGVRVRSPNTASVTAAATGLLIEDLSMFGGAGTVQAINYKSGKFIVDALGNTTIAAGLNLTVDTPSLFVDGTNHRVGVGTITPAKLFSVGAGGPFTVDASGNEIAASVTITGFTPGSVVFASTAGLLAQDNANFFWDATNHRLGITTTSPAQSLDLGSTGSMRLLAVSTSTAGIIFKGTNSFIHNYADPSSQGHNTFVGVNAANFTMGPGGGSNTLASFNTVVGEAAFIANTTGKQCVAIGYNALHANTTGNNNVAVGSGAMQTTTTGSDNFAFGTSAMFNALNADKNVAIGTSALLNDTDGSLNVAIGFSASSNGTHASKNVAIGYQALPANTTGNSNIAIGYQTLTNLNITANDGSGFNTVIGASSGGGITTGVSNTIIGGNVSGLSGSLSNNIIIADGDGNQRITSDSSGNIGFQGPITKYKNITAVGWGVPAIYGTGRSAGAVAAVASVATYTVGAADGSFLVSANVLVTTATLHSFTIECAYTDEGNTPRVLTFSFQLLGGTSVSSITNAQGTVPYEGIPLHLRCKAATTITIRTQAAGTYTTVVYNVEGYITQIG